MKIIFFLLVGAAVLHAFCFSHACLQMPRGIAARWGLADLSDQTPPGPPSPPTVTHVRLGNKKSVSSDKLVS